MKNMPLSLHPILPVALALTAFAVAGCAPKPTIVGKWQGTMTQPSGSINTVMEFTPDGKETITGKATAAGVTVDITAAGTYTVDGTNLTQTLTTMTAHGQTMPIPAHPPQPAPFTLDGDHLTLTNPGSNQPLTLTRVKG